MFYKFTYILLYLIILVGCNNIHQDAQDNYCKSELYLFSKQVLNNTNVNFYSELSDADVDMQSVRIYLKSDSQEGRDVTIGWLKIDKKNYKIYDVSNDEKVLLTQFSDNRVKKFIHTCID